MKRCTVIALAVFIAAAAGPARADTITDWNQTAIEVMKTARVAGNPWSRALAMTHVAMSDAINSVQGRYFGPKPAIPFTTADLLDPNLKRPFNSIAEMADEHRNVRIWGGIHFRNSLEIGDDMGRKIAAYLIANSLKPVR